MKKFIVTSLVLTSMLTHAQEFNKQEKIYFSSETALNNCIPTFDDSNTSNYLGWRYGALANYDLAKNVTVRAGLGYSSFGFGEQFYDDSRELVKMNYKMNTIRVPLEISYYLENRFGITLGVAGLINVDDKFKIKKPVKMKVEAKDTNTFLLATDVKLSWRLKNKNEFFLNIGGINTPVSKKIKDSNIAYVSFGFTISDLL